jgi:hypothetical protein
MNLSERFYYNYLIPNKTVEFTTYETRQWYYYYKSSPNTSVNYANLYYLILRPLLDKGLIKRVLRGTFIVLNVPNAELQKPLTPDQDRDERPSEDDEFFKYLESKMKKGGD